MQREAQCGACMRQRTSTPPSVAGSNGPYSFVRPGRLKWSLLATVAGVRVNLLPEVELLFNAKSESDICRALDAACGQLGFMWGTGFTATQDKTGNWTFRRFGAYADSYREGHNDVGASQVDPVMQYAKRSTLPILWNRTTYARAARLDMWEEQAPHGYAAGITGALHRPDGRAFCVGLDGADDHSRNPRDAAMVMGRYQILQAHLEDAVGRIIGWPRTSGHRETPDLTDRELECLRWSAEGKTIWEIGRLLSISERTVKKHVASAMAALDCVSKTHAVARAIRLQLI
jgi:DNA-binding CsgD family transcriptional regulator